MNRRRITGLMLIMLSSFSMICFISNRIAPALSQITPIPISLPFSTSFESGQPQGRNDTIDWKTNDFSQPVCEVVPNDTNRPNLAGLNVLFGTKELNVSGFFGGNHSYCYFDLFDQEPDSIYVTPIQLQNNTFISVWYEHKNLTCCMIDGELYNKRTGQVWTLRDFSYNNQSIVDQNGTRIHPAARRADPIGSWEYACFDLSTVYESDPGNWYITKIWIGMDNDYRFGNVQTGSATTYFDELRISYGISGAITKVVQYPIYYWNIETNASLSGSLIAWGYSCYGSDYHLLLKLLVSGCVSTAPGNGIWFPLTLKVNDTSGRSQAMANMDIDTINLTTTSQDSSATNVISWGTDCFWLIAGIWNPWGTFYSALELAGQGIALFSQSPPAGYTYQFPEANYTYCEPPCPQSVFGGVFIDIDIGSNKNNIQIPIHIYSDIVNVDSSESIGGITNWNVVDTLETTLTINWTTPDIDTRPAGCSPEVGILNPAPSGSFGVSHLGNPSGLLDGFYYTGDCDMQADIGGQGTAAWVIQGTTVQIDCWGNMWAPGGWSEYPMWAIIGIGDSALNATFAYTGNYPGSPILVTYDLNSTAYQPGTYDIYGIVDIYEVDGGAGSKIGAMDEYWSAFHGESIDPLFLLGTMTVCSANNGIGTFHDSTFTFSAHVCPPLPYLLKNENLNNQLGYVFTELNDSSDMTSYFGGWQSMNSTSNITQAIEDGGNFTYSYNFTGLTANAYYHLIITASGTDGTNQTTDTLIYYAAHDVAITGLTTKSVIGWGYYSNVTVYVANNGQYPETFNVTLRANAPGMQTQPVQTQQLANLNPGPATLTFTWNFTWLANPTTEELGTYSLQANASIVPGENHILDNSFTYNGPTITILGDINGDFTVSLSDLVYLAAAYGTTAASGGIPGNLHAWNPNADIGNYGKVNLGDLVILAVHYGLHYP